MVRLAVNLTRSQRLGPERRCGMAKWGMGSVMAHPSKKRPTYCFLHSTRFLRIPYECRADIYRAFAHLDCIHTCYASSAHFVRRSQAALRASTFSHAVFPCNRRERSAGEGPIASVRFSSITVSFSSVLVQGSQAKARRWISKK